MHTLPFTRTSRKLNNRGLNVKDEVMGIYKEHIKLLKKDKEGYCKMERHPMLMDRVESISIK